MTSQWLFVSVKCMAQNRNCGNRTVPPFKLCAECRERHRECVNAKKSNPSYRAKLRAYAATYNRSDKGRENERRRRERDALKVKARSFLNHAVRDGRAARRSCEVCGDERSQGHHYAGYDRKNWLTVKWLCGAHHREEERVG